MTEHPTPMHHPSCPRRNPTVGCFECGDQHSATLSHWGRFDEGWIYAVVCTVDDLTSYYTTEALDGTCHCGQSAPRTAEDMATDVIAYANQAAVTLMDNAHGPRRPRGILSVILLDNEDELPGGVRASLGVR